MQTPLQLNAVKLVWDDSQHGEWPSSNCETLSWLDTGHSDGVMLFESDTLNAVLAENRMLQERIDALEWLIEVDEFCESSYYNELSADGEDELYAIHLAAHAAVEKQ